MEPLLKLANGLNEAVNQLNVSWFKDSGYLCFDQKEAFHQSSWFWLATPKYWFRGIDCIFGTSFVFSRSSLPVTIKPIISAISG